MGMLRSTRMIHRVASSLIRSRRIAAPLSKPCPLRTEPIIRSPFSLGGGYVDLGPPAFRSLGGGYGGFGHQGHGYGSGTIGGGDGGGSQENQNEGCADGGTSGRGRGSRCPLCDGVLSDHQGRGNGSHAPTDPRSAVASGGTSGGSGGGGTGGGRGGRSEEDVVSEYFEEIIPIILARRKERTKPRSKLRVEYWFAPVAYSLLAAYFIGGILFISSDARRVKAKVDAKVKVKADEVKEARSFD